MGTEAILEPSKAQAGQKDLGVSTCFAGKTEVLCVLGARWAVFFDYCGPIDLTRSGFGHCMPAMDGTRSQF